MVIDQRSEESPKERIIKISIQSEWYGDIDIFIDDVMEDIKSAVTQRGTRNLDINIDIL